MESSAVSSSPPNPDATVALRQILALLFLDVDGVLNPYAWDGPRPGTFADFSLHEARGFPLRLSPAMGARLARLPVEICWATTWSDTIDRDVTPFVGLPAGLHVAARLPLEATAALTNWKFAQIRCIVEQEQRPFVWLDDDALDWPDAHGLTPRQWAGALEIPNLLYAPDPRCGLTEHDLARIERWLNGLDAAS